MLPSIPDGSGALRILLQAVLWKLLLEVLLRGRSPSDRIDRPEWRFANQYPAARPGTGRTAAGHLLILIRLVA